MRVAQQGMIAAAVLGVTALAVAVRTDVNDGSMTTRERVLQAYAKLPLTFVENRGQKDGQVRYYAQGNRYAFYLTREGVVLSFAKGSMAMRFVDANPRVRVSGEQPAAGEVNDFHGSDQSRWRSRLPHYAQVVYRDLWPGV